jgi:hypothetical protein
MGKGEARQVENVVIGYEDVASSLEKDEEIKHNLRVKEAAIHLASLPDKRVPSLLMQTAKRDALVQNKPFLVPKPAPIVEERTQLEIVKKRTILPSIVPAYGAIEGRIQTLSSRGGLRFTTYDLLYDKAVSCYVTEEKQELLRDMWGRLATVEGLIARDPNNGRPISIRDIRNISSLQECERFEYSDARGAAPSLGGLSPEEAIRRIRDAE